MSRKGTTAARTSWLASRARSKQNGNVKFTPLATRFFCATWLLAQMASLAAGVTNAMPHFLIRSWPVERGLPQNKVTTIVQTRDGYLWVGTYSGLARFDGVRFTVFDERNTPGMQSSRVSALFEAADGTLWIGHENGTVTTFKNGQFARQNILGWGGEKIYGISADEESDVWLISASGLLVRACDGLTLTPSPGMAGGLVSFAQDIRGRLWVARNGRLSWLENAQLRPAAFASWFTNAYVQGICAAHDGGLWIVFDKHIRKWHDDRWTEDLGDAPWELSPLASIIETREGLLLCGTVDYGLFILSRSTNTAPLHIDHISGFQADWITSVIEDREGNLWVGTGINGLIGLRANNIETVAPPDNWRGRAVLSVFSGRDGELWVATEGAGLYRYARGEWENFAASKGFRYPYLWSVAQDAAGNIFVGSWKGGLFMGDGKKFQFAPGLEGMLLRISALLPARGGGMWVGTEAGLLRWRDGRTNWIAEANGKSLRDVCAIAEADDGTVWFGLPGTGLASLKDGRIRVFNHSDGLPSDYVECLHLEERGALWIGTFGGGLCRLKEGKFSVIDSEQGLPNSVIGHIEDDGNGYFWMSSHGGILRASKKELNDCAEGRLKSIRILAYGINDGLPTIECSEGSQPAGCKTDDGRLWFSTTKGLVAVNPKEVRTNQLPPPMALEEFIVDGQPVAGSRTPLRIAPGKSHFEFHFTALSFTAPEKVQFKYRIEGLEKDWVNADTKRVAEYSFLPPGNYTFHVIACNNDGLWNEAGVSLPFTLLPHFWQTWWFHILTGLAATLGASGIVWLDARRRMRRRLEKLEREQAIERERARIAKDIHDDLGASLTRITMLSQSARGETEVPEPVGRNLERIFRTARELTRAMDEIVWAVNPRHDTLDSLANYLSRFASDYLSVAGVRCRLDVPLQLPALPVGAEIRHNLFLAFKESLHNVVKHAKAFDVQVELKLAQSELVLRVVDNGHGFAAERTLLDEPSGRISRGNGLPNMKRRLAEIGGACDIQSKPGDGTQVTMTVPLRELEGLS